MKRLLALFAIAFVAISASQPPADPIGARLVESLARPGGNVTGTTNLSRDLGGQISTSCFRSCRRYVA